MDNFLKVIGGFFLTVIGIIFIPFISFWLSYFGGWLCSLVIGDVLCRGLNTLFNSNYFTKDMLPLCAATLGWVGGYFNSKNKTINFKGDNK